MANDVEFFAEKVWFDGVFMFVQIKDGLTYRIPLFKYPRLEQAAKSDLLACELWMNGKWLHWEKLDEDLSIVGIVNEGERVI